MSIYLGVASFVYTLENLKNDFHCSDALIIVWVQGKRPFEFSINAETRNKYNCGFIPTDEKTIIDLFGKNHKIVMLDCVKEHNEKNETVSHCPISKDSVRRGNIPTTKNGITFNCCQKN